ncbi:MAG: ABC transporter ATP-binding protein [Christensenellaceae bacterium]|jgi:energy-coupling factor transporter ATP-binding protein EcfA2
MAGIVWKNVCFSYSERGKHNALENVNLEIEQGKITVLTGPSGCGKSTLLYVAAGIYPGHTGVLKQGCVTVSGEKIGSLPPPVRAKRVGMVFQNPDLQFCMDTVKNELIFCLENIGEDPASMDEIIAKAVDFCGIPRLLDRKLATLSGGEKQKAMLACIVALRPEYLLLDEPFANIDPDAAAELAAKLRKMCDVFGTGIVAVDHHLGHWTEVADEVVLLKPGGRVGRRGMDPANLPQAELAAEGVAVPGVRYQAQKPPKPHAGKTKALELAGVTVNIDGCEVLRGAGAAFYSGQVYAVTGKSGSGKSTFFNTLCRLHKYNGSIRVDGQELKKIPRKKMGHKIGFVFQSPQDQFVTSNVLDEITVGLKGNMDEAQAAAEAERILREIGLWRYRLVSPFMLSQGQQRRLAVAALLAYRCKILVCDEPTYAQDLKALLAVMDGLQRMVAEEGLTLIFSTHDQKLAADFADHVYEMKEGRLFEKY